MWCDRVAFVDQELLDLSADEGADNDIVGRHDAGQDDLAMAETDRPPRRQQEEERHANHDGNTFAHRGV